MSALETLENIISRENLTNADLKYCLIDNKKVPYKVNGERLHPNVMDDFVTIDRLVVGDIDQYAGIGVSIQASDICAIDVDHCFKSPFVIESGDERFQSIVKEFKGNAYCEFSFSGTGMRILFKHSVIDDYAKKYYIKNSKVEVEYYQPSTTSFRYVTVTGRAIYDNPINYCSDETLFNFLNAYMLRPKREKKEDVNAPSELKSIGMLMELVKYYYRTDAKFQDIWFSKAPGSGKDESERDYYLISYIYDKITKNKEQIKEIFESSPYFKSKDWKHINKWEYNDYRYYNYIFETLI